jgi:hypothetical protein
MRPGRILEVSKPSLKPATACASRKMNAEEAVAKLAAAGIAAFTDPLALVRAMADALAVK